jgi:hypothetical protein
VTVVKIPCSTAECFNVNGRLIGQVYGITKVASIFGGSEPFSACNGS